MGDDAVGDERTSTSGAKGFAIVFGAMLGVLGVLWLIAALVAPN